MLHCWAIPVVAIGMGEEEKRKGREERSFEGEREYLDETYLAARSDVCYTWSFELPPYLD